MSFPTTLDWKRWETFWTRVSGPSNSTYRFLGCWINTSHRKYQRSVTLSDWFVYRSLLYNRSGPGRTRSQRTCVCSHVEESQQMSLGRPTSVHAIMEDSVQRLYTGPALSPPTSSPPDIWSFLANWSGTWMWRDIVNSAEDSSDLQWLTTAMRSDTVLWRTDGFISAPEISGASWIIYDTVTEQQLLMISSSGLIKRVPTEVKWLVILPCTSCVVSLSNSIPMLSNKLFCDNEVTLKFKESRRSRRRVPTKKACSVQWRYSTDAVIEGIPGDAIWLHQRGCTCGQTATME